MRTITLSVAAVLCMAGTADASTKADYLAHFRDLHPYHLQTLGISAPAPHGERTLIISEPAVTRRALSASNRNAPVILPNVKHRRSTSPRPSRCRQ
jgi:hypothetical protein